MHEVELEMLERYETLYQLTLQQLAMIELEFDEEQLSDYIEKLKQIELQKRDVQLTISNSHISSASQTFIEKLEIVTNSIRSATMEVEAGINKWYALASKEMKQISVQRKTLHAYSGVSDPDYISYYFDLKK